MQDSINNNSSKYPCVIPTIIDDYDRTKGFFETFFRYLPINEIVLIGPENVREHVSEDIADGLFENIEISFIAENDLVPYAKLKAVFDALKAKTTIPNPSSVNWYYQQFLKMNYATISKADYYLCWDSDTIPLKKIEMFSEEGKPYLDIKTEFNSTYFTTIQRLFGYNKIIEKSFISEHMFFNKQLMLDLIEDINKTPFEADYFYEKAMNAVGADNLAIGFSEFETYGTWIGMKHASAYKLRNWKSFRNLSFFVNINDFNQDDIDWLSHDYHAVTFEKYQETEPRLTELFRNPRYREKLTSEQFLISVLESGALGEYSDGVIKHDGMIAPI